MNNNNTAFIKRTKSVEHSKKLDNSMNKRSMSDKHQTRSKIIIPQKGRYKYGYYCYDLFISHQYDISERTISRDVFYYHPH